MNKAHHFHQGRNAATEPDSATDFPLSRGPAPSPARDAASPDIAQNICAEIACAEAVSIEAVSIEAVFESSERDFVRRAIRVATGETGVIEVRSSGARRFQSVAWHSGRAFNRAAVLGLWAFAWSLGASHSVAHADVSRAVARAGGNESGKSSRPSSPALQISAALTMMTGRGQLLTGIELRTPTRIAPSGSSAWQELGRGNLSNAAFWDSRALTGLQPGLSLTSFESGANDSQPASTSAALVAEAAQATKTSSLPVVMQSAPQAPGAATTTRAAKTQRKSAKRDATASRRQLMTTLALPPAFPVVARSQTGMRWTAPPVRRVRVVRPAASPWAARLWAITSRSTDVSLAVASAPATSAPAARVVAKKAAVRAQLMRPKTIAKARPSGAWTVGALPPADMMPRALPVSQSLSPDAHEILPLRDASGAPMKRIITVAQLKQLPPSSQPLPAKLRRKVIRLDDNASTHAAGTPLAPALPRLAASPDNYRRAQTRLAQNAGAAPLRQPIRPVTSSDRLPNQLEVSVGTFVVLLTTSDLDTVAIAEPGVADVSVVNSRAVLVNGKTPGVTSLVIVDRFKIRQYQVRVVAAPGGLPRDILAQIALPGVGVRQVRDAIVLEGEVDSAEEVRRAVEIAGIYSPKVINQLRVRGVLSGDAALATQIESTINLPNVSVRLIGETTVIDGTVETLAQRSRAQIVAEALSKKVLNLITMPALTLDQVRESLGNGAAINGNGGDAANGVQGDATNGTGAMGVPGATSTFNGADPSVITPGIRIRQVGDQIILEGFANDQARIDEAVATATRTGLQVINRVQVVPALPIDVSFRAEAERAMGIPGIRVSGNAKMAILHGTVSDSNQALLAEQIMHAYAAQVENMLQTTHPLLVNIDASIVELTKTGTRNLGSTVTDTLAFGDSPAGPGAGPITGNNNFRRITPFQVTLSALIANNQARLLSNPRTTVLSGRSVGFLVGGQVPVPAGTTTNNGGTTTQIVFKDFGVLVDVLPVASASGNITMRVRTEVSQPDFTIGFTLPGGGSIIPGFGKRVASSEVTVPRGGTIALTGLIQNNVTKFVSRIPLLSRIPIIGSLFTSKRFVRNESELVVFLTPRLLPNPLRDGESAPLTVYSHSDNAGTPNIGTGAIQTGPITSTPGWGDRNPAPGAPRPPVAAGSNSTSGPPVQ